MKLHTLWLGASALALTLACGAAAHAQTATPVATKSDKSDTSEVVVTAERRSTNLQTTAIAATVLTQADIIKKGVFTVDQLQFVSPSITVNNFGQGNDVDVRGIGKGEHNTQTGTGVVTYRDGVATFPGYIQEEPFYDISTVEVLRGPQGTFSGQNATGGALIVNTQDPKINGGYHGYLLGHYGNYNDGALQGAVNLPISDTLAARVAFNGEHRSSFYNVGGKWDGDPNLNWAGARFSLLWTPTPQLKFVWKTDYDYLQNGAYFGTPILNPTTGKPNGNANLFNLSNNYHTFATDQMVRTVLKADYVDPGTGITVRNIASYQQGRSAWTGDIDGTAASAPSTDFYIQEAVNERLYTEEVNVISPDKGPLTWILGGYYQNNRYLFPPNRFTIGLRSLGLNENLDGVNNTHSSAVFGQVTYKLPAGFELQGGLRYSSWYTANNPVHYYVPQLLAFGYNFTQSQQYTGDNLTGKLTLNWHLDDNNFLYVFMASGAKPGGLNTALYFGGGGTPAPFKQETVTDYEFGWKTRLFENHVKLQFGGFYNIFRNFQLIVPIPNQPTQSTEQNVPKVKLYGVEASAQATFGDLSGSFGIGLQNSELGTFYAQDPRVTPTVAVCNPNTGPGAGTCLNLKGKSQTYAPDFTFNANVQYNFHINHGDLLTPSLSFSHISDQWGTVFENTAAGDHLSARNIFNATVSWTHGDIVTSLYCYNLTDQHYVAALLSPVQLAGPPRQFGVSVMKVF